MANFFFPIATIFFLFMACIWTKQTRLNISLKMAFFIMAFWGGVLTVQSFPAFFTI